MGRFGRGEPPARVRLDHGAQGVAAGVGELQVGGFQPAGVGLAADVGPGEAHGLLLGKPEHLDRIGQRHAAAFQLGQRDDRQHDAQRAVEAAGVAHGVEVGAEQKGLRPG